MKNLVPNLLNIIVHVESDRDEIVSQWIKIQTVKNVFKLYKISTKKFKVKFGVPILEYFISDVREEKEAGDCPVMSKLVLFLLEKDITPQGVFEICMGLRRSLVSYLFQKGLIAKNALEVMDEIAKLFDTNLSGVLKIFTTYYQKRQQSVNHAIAYQQKLKQITKIINFVNTKIFLVQNSRIIMGNQSFFNTIGVKDIKEFYQKYKYTCGFMRKVDCFEEDYKKSIDTWLEKIYENNESFKATIYNYQYSKEFIYSGRVTTLPESDPIQYIITLNNINSYLEDQTEIKSIVNFDELTGLNSYSTFEYLLTKAQEKAEAKGTKLALAITDIHNLRDMNKQKGREYEDKVIIDVSKSIKSLANETMTLFHLEESKFGVLMPCKSEQECYDWCSRLYMTLNAKIENISVCVTSFKPDETINSLQMRAYDLCDLGTSLDDEIVQNDFKDITPFINLSDQKQFTDILKNVKTVNTTIYYKELPVSLSNTILHVDKNNVIFRLLAKQFFIAGKNEIIYLKLPKLGFVKAYIKDIDNVNMTVTIHKFGLEKYFPMQRSKFRIQVEKKTNISIVKDETVINSEVLDLNEEGIAFVLENKKDLYKGALVSVKVMLKIENKLEYINTSATVHKIKMLKDKYKIVLIYHLNSLSKELLHKYIAKRQIEIINEIRDKAKYKN